MTGLFLTSEMEDAMGAGVFWPIMNGSDGQKIFIFILCSILLLRGGTVAGASSLIICRYMSSGLSDFQDSWLGGIDPRGQLRRKKVFLTALVCKKHLDWRRLLR